MQELELHNRYIAALDALSSPHQAAAARHALDHAAAAAHEAACGISSGGAGGLSSGGASMDLPPASASRLDVFDARLRRTLAEHVSRNEAAEVRAEALLDIRNS
jgi:hypothetical protein